MKAVLVIHIFEDVGKYHADIYREDEKGNGEMIATYLPFKSMPKRLLHEYEQVDDAYGYVEGWNACLDAIEGDEE